MKRILLTIYLIAAGNMVMGQGTGFEVLGISPSPYSLSKAEATVSSPDGAASIYSNPGLLPYNNSSSIDLGYSFWIAGVNNIFGGVNFKNNKRAIAFSFYSSGSDDYQQRNTPGSSNGNFSIQYLSLSAAYAYDLNYFSLGVAAQYLNESIFTYRASGYAFNFGAASQFLDDRVRLGASITNAGEMQKLNVERTPLPANLKVGTSVDIAEVTAPKNEDLPILISLYADYVHPLEETSDKDFADYTASDNYFNLGMSLTVAEVLEVSGGYKTQKNARPVAFGAAFTANNVTVNYALIPFNTGYGTVHSIGVQYKF